MYGKAFFLKKKESNDTIINEGNTSVQAKGRKFFNLRFVKKPRDA